MKLGYFIFAFVVIGSATAQWEELIGQVATKLMGWVKLILGELLRKCFSYRIELCRLWTEDHMEFLGHRCMYSTSPTIRRWQLHYKTKVMCPGWTSIIGHCLFPHVVPPFTTTLGAFFLMVDECNLHFPAKTKSPSGSLEHATRDFVSKALKSG